MAVYQDKDKKGKIIKTKDGRSWYFKVYKKDFEGNNKAYKSKKYNLKSDAEKAEALFLLKRDNPIHKDFVLIANDYLNNLRKIRKESTYYSYKKDYENHIYPFFKNFKIDLITISNIKSWGEYLYKKNLSISYMNKIYIILNCIFEHAIKDYGLCLNPVRIIGPFQKRNDRIIPDNEKLRYINFEDFKIFINTIDNIMWKTFFIFLYYTGMRRGEVQALTWNDVDFDNDEIIVNKSLSVKTNSSIYLITNTKNYINRKIKINKTLKESLLEYKKYVMQYKDYSDKWFVFGNSRFLPQTTIDRYKNKYFELANIKPITIHEFRHSHVSLLINEYINTSKSKNMKIDTAKFFLMMSNRMGHTIQVMQSTYMHLFPTIQDEIVDLLDNL